MKPYITISMKHQSSFLTTTYVKPTSLFTTSRHQNNRIKQIKLRDENRQFVTNRHWPG